MRIIKPCRFCGSGRIAFKTVGHDGLTLECQECFARGPVVCQMDLCEMPRGHWARREKPAIVTPEIAETTKELAAIKWNFQGSFGDKTGDKSISQHHGPKRVRLVSQHQAGQQARQSNT